MAHFDDIDANKKIVKQREQMQRSDCQHLHLSSSELGQTKNY
jgi:hypothetical protein